MKWIYKLLAFLSNFSIGLVSPILSLMLCQHGCSLKNIGLAVAVFSITVIVTEVPSGIFADMHGRKLSFIASRIAGALSAAVMLLSHSFALTAAGLSLMGLSTAFASGTLDALAVEDAVRQKGMSVMTRTVSSFLTFQCAGLAGGALIGGFLPYSGGYALHLLIKCAVCLATTLVALALPHEVRSSAEKSAHPLRSHLGKMIRLFGGSPALKDIAICIISISIVQAALETYWQPQLSGILTNGVQTVLGALSAAAYLATTFGCIFLGQARIDNPRRCWIIYLFIGGGFALFTALLSFASNAVFFSVVYIALYLLIGMLSVSEQTIINRETSDDVRASLLSVTSFAARMGGIISGVVSSLLLTGGNISLVWRITAFVMVVGLAVVSNGRRFKHRTQDLTNF